MFAELIEAERAILTVMADTISLIFDEDDVSDEAVALEERENEVSSRIYALRPKRP